MDTEKVTKSVKAGAGIVLVTTGVNMVSQGGVDNLVTTGIGAVLVLAGLGALYLGL